MPPCSCTQVTDGFRLSFRRLEYDWHNPGKDKVREERDREEKKGLRYVRTQIERQGKMTKRGVIICSLLKK